MRLAWVAAIWRRPVVGCQPSRCCSSVPNEQLQPQAEYDSRIRNGRLSRDVHQEAVVAHLQRLYDRVATSGYCPPSLDADPRSVVGRWMPRTVLRWVGAGSEANVKVPKGLYLWGTVGGGKTMLMDLFFETVCCPDRVRKRRMHYHDFMQEVHWLMHEAKKSLPPRDMSRWDTYQPFDPIPSVAQALIRKSWLLCLDEFQVTDVADAMILKQLFSQLFQYGLVLVATSNRPPDDLYKNGLQRSHFLPFIDVLKRRNLVVSLDPGVDYRRKSMAGAERLYFDQSDPDVSSNAAMDAMFKFMASKETDSIRSRTIRIRGRDVVFSKTCGRVADCTFEELCGRPLWTNDYIKMAQVFHTVFVRDIPVLGVKTKSEARRFICMIDTFYDHKVRVVASGARPYWKLFLAEQVSHQDRLDQNRQLIDDLGIRAGDQQSLEVSVFSGEEEVFAFDRTVSRLTEMQTQHYWAQWKLHLANKAPAAT